MATEKEYSKLSKFLSLVLRHQPDLIGIVLDKNGWTDVEALITGCSKSGVYVNLQVLEHVVATNNKRRFSFNHDHTRIRANQGHSVEVDLGYIPKEPPSILYHGTTVRSVDSIILSGLEKKERHHVHLSEDIETARKVGGRRGKPFVFEVLAAQMFKDGTVFYQSDNGVWLTDHVPPRYLRALEKDDGSP